jgi:hypothetical protein
MGSQITSRLFLLSSIVAAACGDGLEPPPPGLAPTVAPSAIDGTFSANTLVVAFHASSSAGGRRATLALDIGGKTLDVAVDLDTHVLSEDTGTSTFDFADRAALLALRDTAAAEHPEWSETLHGNLLLKTADRYAEVPIGHPLARHVSTFSLPRATGTKSEDLASACGDDGVTCLPGTSGTSYAVFSIGDTCYAARTPYGDSVCRGRCGIGCNPFDQDYTWDCLDHDVCLDYSSDCSDEFAEAADDWIATLAPLCW